MLMALDTETTGKDLYHSCRPYFVTFCQPDGTQVYYEWDVDPLTRMPCVPECDLSEIDGLIADADELVLQNGKFDVTALATLDPRFGENWPWECTHDTLLAAHLLGSNRPKDLTSLGITYLGRNIQHLEDTLGDATKAARRMARSRFKDWKIAKAGMEELPSAKKSGSKADDKLWKNDAWLPRAIAQACDYPWPYEECKHDWDADYLCKHCEGCSWWILLREYANADSAVTLAAWIKMKAELKRRGLWKHYEHRRKLPQITYDMERRGVTQSKSRTLALETRLQEEAFDAGQVCANIAAEMGYKLELPNGAGVNNSLRTFCLDVLKLEPQYSAKAKTATPTLDKQAMEHYLLTLDKRSKPLLFIQRLFDKRKRDTSLAFLEAYQKFWIKAEDLGEDWYVLHPSYNITGSDTLRFSCQNPNTQQISKKGMYEGDKSNIRECFGPDPEGEWWSLDAKNIELRIPFYKSGEQTLIDLFERPNEPPYYGSNHLANFHAVYPDIWERELAEVGFDKVGPHCKKKYASTWYQWCKNGGFAKQYGGQRRKVDSTFRRDGAFDLLESKFSKLTQLNRQVIAFARKHGYVETLPSKFIDPSRGYPLLCTRNDYGGILETVPLSYMVQGTAMEWTCTGMVRCEECLAQWRKEGFNAWMVLQVHDELVFRFPRGADPRTHPEKSNLGRVRELARLLRLGGDDIGIPIDVGIEYNPVNWSEGYTMSS